MNPVVVVVTGAESTGKSTLASALTRELGATLVPEFARAYAERVRRPLTAADVEPIARGQVAAQDAALEQVRRRLAGEGWRHRASGLLILDTDLLSTLVYTRHYYGDTMPELESLVRERRPDAYLLAGAEFPFEPDPVRDSAHAREALHEKFMEATGASGVPTTRLLGTVNERLRAARKVARSLLDPRA